MSSEQPLLEVKNLKTQFATDRGTVTAVDGISYTLDKNEIMGFVGESGAGKSVTGKSVLNLIAPPGRIVGGEVLYKGQDILKMDEKELRKLRGDELSIVFQDSMTALNPSYRIGKQLVDTIVQHKDINREEAREKAIQLLDDVNIPDAESRVDDYPHQFSGGMRQRVLIALGLSCDPEVLIADEITTALDVTIEAEILELLEELQDKHGIAIQLITHDMGVIAEICDKVGVMYAGRLVEVAALEDIFYNPRHPYTVGLLNALPQSKGPGEKLEPIPGTMPDLVETPSGCSFRDRCDYATEECAEIEPPLESVDGQQNGNRVACIRAEEIGDELRKKSIESAQGSDERVQNQTKLRKETGDPILETEGLKKYFVNEGQSWIDRLVNETSYVHAVDDISISIHEQETLGLVGESGCGKTTLGRTVTKLYEETEGRVVFSGTDLSEASRKELRELRSGFQVIFQDPFSSLNPRRTVENIIGRPMEIHGIVSSKEERQEKVVELLEEVGLKESHLDRYAHEFSGGQKQRVGIARALGVEPDLIVCDEPVSALDVSVQAKILNLMMDLQEEYGLSYLFIAHNLSVVRHISDRVAVMYLGEIAEIGRTEQVFSPPYHPYTEVLLSSIPSPTPEEGADRKRTEGELPSPINPPSGCRFHTRCPYAMPECETEVPKSPELAPGHEVQCHLFDDEIMKNKEIDPNEITAQQMTMSEMLRSETPEEREIDSRQIEGDE